MDQNTLIFGIHPVQEALRSAQPLERLYLKEGRRDAPMTEIFHAAKARGVDVRFEPWERLTARAGNSTHQGVVAVCAVYQYVDLDDLLARVRQQAEPPFLLILDQIQDPHNLGAILRSAECAGAHGVILPKHHAVGVTPTVIKVAAGATAYLPVCRVTNIASTIDELKAQNIWVVGTSDRAAQAYVSVDWTIPVAIVIGNEEVGLRRLVAEKCDLRVAIPLHGQLSSLNASVAGGILLFEARRQRSLALKSPGR